ncbi:MAG: DUF4892 domain-containing protein [Pseudohongiella sp.]|nr:DUF4892 domain-containing protein [Pseudohongiella sp.]
MKFLNYSICKRLSLAAWLTLLATSSFAQVEFSTASLSDHSLIAGFPDSEIISRELEQDISHRLVLGSLQRSRGEVVPENFQRLRGDVSRITYDVSQEFTGENVNQYYREQMQSRGYSELFSCSGRACGSSNFWANDVFSNRSLYGPERNQFYLAMKTNTGLETESYIALYIITKGNRKIYAYLEIIELGGTRDPIPERAIEALPEPIIEIPADTVEIVGSTGLLDLLREKRSIILPALEFDSDTQLSDAADLSSTVALLNADSSIRVYLVAHLQGTQSLEVLLRRSALRAATLRESLISLGVDGGKIIAQGIGPLAPACETDYCAERIELVLQ